MEGAATKGRTKEAEEAGNHNVKSHTIRRQLGSLTQADRIDVITAACGAYDATVRIQAQD